MKWQLWLFSSRPLRLCIPYRHTRYHRIFFQIFISFNNPLIVVFWNLHVLFHDLRIVQWLLSFHKLIKLLVFIHYTSSRLEFDDLIFWKCFIFVNKFFLEDHINVWDLGWDGSLWLKYHKLFVKSPIVKTF